MDYADICHDPRGPGISRRALLVSLAAAGTMATVVTHAEAEDAARIVIAGGDLTEIAFALGAGDRVIGVDSTSTFPVEAQDLDQIGYVRRLSAEGILSLAPDLLLLAHDAGPDTAVAQLEAVGVPIARAPDADTAAGVAPKIRFVGGAIGKAAEAEELARAVDRQLAEIAGKVRTLPDKPRVLFVLSLERGAPLVGGAGTSADEMIMLAGGQNAVAGVTGYKPLSQEAIISLAPDVLLMMSQHAERYGGLDTVTTRPEFALTPAGRNGHAIAMEGMLLLGFGPRTPQAIADLARALHPETAAQAGL